MPTNVTYEYENAEKKLHQAQTTVEKIKALQEMLAKAPKHKGAANLLKSIKERIKKYKGLALKEKKSKKGSSFLSIKKEGAARISIIGLTNTGRSTLLSKLTNAKPIISELEYTTKLPNIGILDYKGIKLQIIEIPAIVKKYNNTKHGLFFLSLIRDSNLIIITLNEKSELNLIKNELKENDIDKRFLLYQKEDIKEFKDDIWNNLNLIKVYTKQPSKKKEFPPVSLKKGSKLRGIAETVHKDFIKKFIKVDRKGKKIINMWGRIWGKSAKFPGQKVGLGHVLKDGDIVELHLPK